ncbi:hypothetical protein AB0G77_37045 [Streptomyces hygroscopicus]
MLLSPHAFALKQARRSNGTIFDTGADSYRLAITRARAEEAAKPG